MIPTSRRSTPGSRTRSCSQQLKGGANWNDVAYVPDVDDRVAGIEVNGGDDIEWYVKALTKGWHVGPVANEDEHQREWATSSDGKTLMLTRGRSPRDYYFALREPPHGRDPRRARRTARRAPRRSCRPILVLRRRQRACRGGHPGPGRDAARLDDPHRARRTRCTSQLAGVPAGSRVALVSNTTGGQAAPIPLGAADAAGTFTASRSRRAPADRPELVLRRRVPAVDGPGVRHRPAVLPPSPPRSGWLADPFSRQEGVDPALDLSLYCVEIGGVRAST